MKKLLFTVLCIGVFLGVKAQTSPEPLPIVEFATDAPPKIDTSERTPSFVGGEKQLTAYLKKNTCKLIDDHTQGRVIVIFVFERDEILTDVKVVRTYLRIQIPKLTCDKQNA